MQLAVHRILFVLLTIRLLLPPGICVCQWHSPAARIVASFLHTGKRVPPPPVPENEDDHEPGCPASKLAAGMGLRPASPPLCLPEPAADAIEFVQAIGTDTHAVPTGDVISYRPPSSGICLTVCALRI